MRKGSVAGSRLTCHIAWVTKYRYHVLSGDVQKRCRQLVIQICEVGEIVILKGVVNKDHVHIRIEYPPRLALSQLMQRIKGPASQILQRNSPREKMLLGPPLLGYRLQSMVQQYLEPYRSPGSWDSTDFIMK